MTEQGRLVTALRSIAAEVETAQAWNTTSRAMVGERIVTVFGSARGKRGQPSYELARELGTALAERGWTAVTGGGPGIMQAVRDGSGDTLSRAVRIEIPGEEPETELDSTRSIIVGTFALRKLLLTHDIDALFVLPGGLGTFDELFEVLTHQVLDRLHPFPVILMQPEGIHIWDAWLRFMDEHVVRPGLLDASALSHVVIAKNVEDALALAESATPWTGAADDALTGRTEEGPQAAVPAAAAGQVS
ncbi:TIGR00730 family Rossman fold protein [Nonomuraea sp. K274]|uniref:Cytokinin riboside 5'-monophosphate phosphoribohydrolase n=1 Tax=Nonomuraea cypriaca TaxID=1187855 RepID=A0A931A1L3_9ACTN|nr:TIGR00730 family Rossman fold protein [Nonomuraea cypriaca]MBF8184516.1 TIGR00730 family Rossman fold protein [Nonomuraea cypriaca]